MAQRSARARVKLDKISSRESFAQSGFSAASRQNSGSSSGKAAPHSANAGVARLGSGGLLTPSASSVSGSSRNSLQLAAPPRIGKGTLRSFLDAQGEKLRGRLAHSHRRDGSTDHGPPTTTSSSSSFYSGLGGGVIGVGPPGLGSLGLGGLGSIGEEKMIVKRWEGSGGKGEIWDGGGKGKKVRLRPSVTINWPETDGAKDLELWFPDGDTLVYLTERPQPSRNPQGLYKPPVPQPSFRLRSSVLKQTESPFLLAQLELSYRDRPPTPAEDSPGSPMDEGNEEELAMDYEYQLQRSKTMGSSATVGTEDGVDAGILYRLYLPAPPRYDKVSRHRYHLTTRNFFAVLFDKSLVGVTLGQTLLDLVDRTDLYLSSPSSQVYDEPAPYSTNAPPRQPPPKHANTHRLILDYLQGRELDDVRNWPEGAAGLLVWSERAAPLSTFGMGLSDLHRIEAIWREGFIHCTGMLASLEGQSEWREISPITKALIDRASLEIQVRVSNADQRMIGFNFEDMWPVMSATSPSARASFDKFQKFLLKHYHSRFGAWPPQDGRLTRTYYVHLQRDFAALYDYLVDHEAVWSPAPDQRLQPNQRRKILKAQHPNWRADDDDLPISEILQQWDLANGHPAIPHPFPLVPASPSHRLGHHCSITSTSPPLANKRQQRFFPTTSSASLRNRAASNPAAALALTESTNIETLYASRTVNPLVEAFTAHEKSVPPSECSPHDARKGRWVLIYAVLQTLASVAVDTSNVKWSDGVEYFLNAKLRGTPPWKTTQTPTSDDGPDERSHFRSHCWVAGKAPPLAGNLSGVHRSLSSAMAANAPTVPDLPEMATAAQQASPPPSRSSRDKVAGPARSTLQSPQSQQQPIQQQSSHPHHHHSSRHERAERAARRITAAVSSAETMSVEMEARRSNSGDEGDDEMDEGSSPPAYMERSLSPPATNAATVSIKTERNREAQKMRWQDAWGAGAEPDDDDDDDSVVGADVPQRGGLAHPPVTHAHPHHPQPQLLQPSATSATAHPKEGPGAMKILPPTPAIKMEESAI